MHLLTHRAFCFVHQVCMERAGGRVAKRKHCTSRVGFSHRVTKYVACLDLFFVRFSITSSDARVFFLVLQGAESVVVQAAIRWYPARKEVKDCSTGLRFRTFLFLRRRDLGWEGCKGDVRSTKGSLHQAVISSRSQNTCCLSVRACRETEAKRTAILLYRRSRIPSPPFDIVHSRISQTMHSMA